MTLGTAGNAIRYQLCRYEGTKLSFRGPPVSFDAPYVAALGGTETFGPFVEAPYPTLLSEWLGQPVVNLGVRHAGVPLFASTSWMLECASKADVAVFQILGAGNMSNRLYRVHSRRNDRFLSVSPALKAMFPKVDFTEFSFIRHLLQSLAGRSEEAFAIMLEELRTAWLHRMQLVLSSIDAPVVLLWMSDRSPNTPSDWPQGPEPLFVTHHMLDALARDVAGIVEVVSTTEVDRLEGKNFAAGERKAAVSAPTPAHHAMAAEALCDAIQSIKARRKLLYAERDHRVFPRSRSAS